MLVAEAEDGVELDGVERVEPELRVQVAAVVERDGYVVPARRVVDYGRIGDLDDADLHL